MNKLALALILSLVIILAGCSNGISDSTGKSINTVEDKYVDVGAILMLTGPAANQGESSRRGAELAAREINENGGVNGKQIRIKYADTPSGDAKAAVSEMTKFLSEGTQIFLGPTWSNTALAMSPIACDKKAIMISPTAGVEFNKECEYLFAMRPKDSETSYNFGKYIYSQGHRKIAIMGTTQVWEDEQAKKVRDGFKDAGGDIVFFDLGKQFDKDYRPEALKIKESNPDAVVFANTVGQQILAKRLRELGFDKQFYSVFIYEDTLKSHEGAMDGTIVVTDFNPTEKFITLFKQEYNVEPDVGSDNSYDALMLIAESIRETKSEDTKVLAHYMNSVKRFNGASGNFGFDNDRRAIKSTKFQVIENQKLKDI